MSFAALGLSEPLLRIIEESGYASPTPIQVEAIPAILDGKDVMAAAQTGTGKTAGFALPLLQRLADKPGVQSNHVRVLVLTPTRELAVQVAESFVHYGKYLPLKSGVVYGGVKINPQMMRLRGGLDVLVATPGRLLDLFSQNAVKFTQLESLVLDEADRMLDLGFSLEIGKILALLPKRRQNLLFSATFSDEIRKLADTLLTRPLQLEVSPRNSAAASVEQRVFEVDKGRKPALLSHLILRKNWDQVLVFVRTRKGADQLVLQLERDGISSVAIHGDKNQNERSRALARFKANRVRVLVATDVAARGLDINELPYVVNFDLPKVPQDYIHRIGRTGRAGSEGQGISLVSADEVKLLAAIEGLLHQTLVRDTEQGFLPAHKVPLSQPAKVRPKKAKKVKPQKELTARNKPTEPKTNSRKKPATSRKNQESENSANTSGGRGRRRGANDSSAAPKRSANKPKQTVPHTKQPGRGRPKSR